MVPYIPKAVDSPTSVPTAGKNESAGSATIATMVAAGIAPPITALELKLSFKVSNCWEAEGFFVGPGLDTRSPTISTIFEARF